MPLHKSGRAHRLDPTMISAPLGDFRHTMHVGRGGDAFGDTSFLSSHGPAKPESPATTESFSSTTPPELASNDNTANHNITNHTTENKPPDEALPTLQHSESVSSFDLDLDLGPSILGDVLGVMDGLGLGAQWAMGNEADEDVFGSNRNHADEGLFVIGATNELYEKRTESLSREEEHRNDVNDVKSKGLRPKVRFSDKKEEIVGRQYVVSASEEEHEKEMQMRAEQMGMKEAVRSESINHHGHDSPSPSSSMSSEYEGISPLDRRREDHLSESGSEEDGISGEQGYTFEDESDDEIGL